MTEIEAIRDIGRKGRERLAAAQRSERLEAARRSQELVEHIARLEGHDKAWSMVLRADRRRANGGY